MHRTILGLALIDSQQAQPGTAVTVLWGEATEPAGIRQIRATLQPAPYNEFARTQYRQGTIQAQELADNFPTSVVTGVSFTCTYNEAPLSENIVDTLVPVRGGGSSAIMDR